MFKMMLTIWRNLWGKKKLQFITDNGKVLPIDRNNK